MATSKSPQKAPARKRAGGDGVLAEVARWRREVEQLVAEARRDLGRITKALRQGREIDRLVEEVRREARRKPRTSGGGRGPRRKLP